MSEDSPRIDQLPGARHPSETREVFGHDRARARFDQALTSGRLHHAWLVSGPRGIGKATFAYQVARRLLGDDPDLETRIQARSEPRLRVVSRTENDQGRMRADIVVDDIRRLSDFFHLSATDGGHRVVILDAADEMNVSAANALLKMLEEPPKATTLLLIAHQPGRLLPTIRSRCRQLHLSPLSQDDLTQALSGAGIADLEATDGLVELAAGSVGDAIRLHTQNGLDVYSDLTRLMSTLPRLDRAAAQKLADRVAQRGAESERDMLLSLLDILLARLSRQGALGHPAPEVVDGEAHIFARLAPNPFAARQWAEASAELGARLRKGLAVNLDPAALVLDTLLKLNNTARDLDVDPA